MKKKRDICSQQASLFVQMPNLLDSFANVVARVMAALDTFIKNEDAGRTEAAAGGEALGIQSSKTLGTPRLKNFLQELSDLLNKRDADAIKLVAVIKTWLGPSNISDNFLKLESQINCLKFEQAKKVLAQTTKELNF